MRNGRWIVIGALTVDTVVRADATVTKIGGVVTYAGLTLKRLGIPTCVVTVVGKNEASLTRLFDDEGIEVVQQLSAETTRFVNHIDGDARSQEMPSRADPVAVSQLEKLRNDVGGYYLGPLHPDDISDEALDHVAKTNTYVAVDIQGYLRQLACGNVVRGAVSEKLPRVLRMAHCVKASASELELVCAKWGMRPHDVMNRFNLEELVITAGSTGGWIMKPCGDKIRYHGEAVERIVDTTGAGDVFFAAYIALRQAMGRGMEEACHSAARWAARHVEGSFIDENLLKVNTHLS